MENNEEEKKGPLFKLQYMGYFLAGFDPERRDFKFADYLRIAKFYLCEDKGLLMKDPIWDKYSDEEILIEYFASLYKTNKEVRDAFELELLHDQADDEWMDAQIRKRKQDRNAKALKMEEEVTFDPSEESLGE